MEAKYPTHQQVAYLDELKQRLRELRARQESFIQQTVEMIREIEVVGSARHVHSLQSKPNADVDEQERISNIKLIIQRFEDFSETSRQFSELPTPNELIGVDVQRLLKGYEQLIDDGIVLQGSLLLLNKSKENLGHLNYYSGEKKIDRQLTKEPTSTNKKLSDEPQPLLNSTTLHPLQQSKRSATTLPFLKVQSEHVNCSDCENVTICETASASEPLTIQIPSQSSTLEPTENDDEQIFLKSSKRDCGSTGTCRGGALLHLIFRLGLFANCFKK